jgi:hypothetical protein
MSTGDAVMITKIETLADIAKLPTSLQHALRPRPNSTGTRQRSNINAAERKLAIQRQVVAAIRDGRQASGGQAPVVVPLRGDPAAAVQALAQQGPFDAGVIGAAGLPARLAAQALPGAGLAQGTRVFGTHLWHEDSQLAQEPSLAGALYPGPDSIVRRNFDARYNTAFGERAPRLAGTAYDAAALAARGAREGARSLPLGEAFHSRRLRLISSQVGAVAPAMRGRRSFGERMAQALALLADPALEALIGPATRFEDLPDAIPGLLNPAPGQPAPLCPLVTYGA